MLWLTGFLGLTQISQIPRHCFVGGKSHRWLCAWAGSRGFHFAFGLTQISQIPRYCFVGGKSHRWLCAWAGSRGFHFAFGLTQISQIPRYCFVGGKSHRCFCGCGLVPWGCLGLALTDLFFGPFGPFRPIGQIRPISNRTDWTFLKIIREICGICVRPR